MAKKRTDHIAILFRKFLNHSPFMLVGHNARLALDAARILDRWEDLESNGYVRIVADFDSDARKDWDCPSHCTRNSRARDRKYNSPCTACRAWEQDGAFYVYAQFRTDVGGEWETADSIGGCIGYANPSSPYENCYVIDMMRAAINGYKSAVLAGLGTPQR